MALQYIYQVSKWPPEDITEILGNESAEILLRSTPKRALAWDTKGTLLIENPDISLNKNAAHVQSMVAFIYGKKYEVHCGMCVIGGGNHKDCVGFPGENGISALSNGACANCI